MTQNESFYSYMNGKTSIAEDKSPHKNGQCYTIFCSDFDGAIPKLINAIKKHGNGGHSFEIVVDADSNDKESIFWDGDGSDRIDSIIQSPEKDTDSVVRMCLHTLDSIHMQAKDALIEKEEFGEKPPTEEEKKQAFKDICHDSHLLLSGCRFKDNCRSSLERIRDFIKDTKEFYANGLHEKTVEKLMEDLEHIENVASEGLEKGLTLIGDEEE